MEAVTAADINQMVEVATIQYNIFGRIQNECQKKEEG